MAVGTSKPTQSRIRTIGTMATGFCPAILFFPRRIPAGFSLIIPFSSRLPSGRFLRFLVRAEYSGRLLSKIIPMPSAEKIVMRRHPISLAKEVVSCLAVPNKRPFAILQASRDTNSQSVSRSRSVRFAPYHDGRVSMLYRHLLSVLLLLGAVGGGL